MSSPSRDCAHFESPKICKTNWTAFENLQNLYFASKSRLNFVVFADISIEEADSNFPFVFRCHFL